MTEHNLPDKDDAPWLDCLDGFKDLSKPSLPRQQWDWSDEAEISFQDWFQSQCSPFSLMSEYFYEDCKVEDLKTREDLMYKWLHLAYVTGFMYGGTPATESE
jgi:hypothetical protein